MEANTTETWKAISDDARVWIWASPKKLSEATQKDLTKDLQHFVSQWTSHQVALKAAVQVVHDHFVIVGLDESASTGASGCSIDALTHHIQRLSSSYELDLQDRQTFYFVVEGEIHPIHMQEVSGNTQGISKDTLVVDTLVKTKGQLIDQWIRPAGESWHARFF